MSPFYLFLTALAFLSAGFLQVLTHKYMSSGLLRFNAIGQDEKSKEFVQITPSKPGRHALIKFLESL